MKKYVLILLAAALAGALVLSGCGGSAPAAPAPTAAPTAEPTAEPTPEPIPTPDPAVLEQMRREDAVIRAAMEDEDFGLGEKLAIYDEKEDLFFFHGAWLPDGLRAETPEEIGGFLFYHSVYTGGMSQERAEKLGMLVESVGLADPAGSEKAVASVGGLLPEFIDASTKVKYSSGTESTLEEWLRLKFPPILKAAEENRAKQLRVRARKELLERLNDPAQTVEFSDGKLFVGYDEVAGVYTMDRVPEGFRAWSADEVGYIFSFRSTWGTESAQYKDLGWVNVPVETLVVRILVASDGQPLDVFSINMHAPAYLNKDMMEQHVTSTDVLIKLQELYQKHKMEWPF